MHKKAYLVIALFFTAYISSAQTTYLPLGSDDYTVLDKLETRSGRLCDSLQLGDKGEGRRNAVNFVESRLVKMADSTDSTHYSARDVYNMHQLVSENGEWAPDENGAIDSKHPWFRTFYKKQYDFIYVKTKDFFVVVNPVIYGQTLVQHNDPSVTGINNRLSSNSHDFEIRGWIGKKVGFYTSLTDNQEVFPYYVLNSVNKVQQAVPGADYYIPPAKRNTGNYDYILASGYIDFAAVKDHLNITFGQGKHFIGDGITSLFLSDYSSNMPFLQARARIWKLNYEVLYLELTQQYNKNLGDALTAHKFSTMHYITTNISHWLNVGFFESVVFDRPNVYEISYLNPVILTLANDRYNGQGDKSVLGFTAKAIAAKHLQFYTQIMLNEFIAKELFSNKGYYANKYGVQFGGKYFDAFGVSNLDLQGEIDAVRPYTYTAKDTLANYTNYNQPLADPLGAGFIKALGIVRYQATKKLTLTLKSMYYVQGLDTGGQNFGNNIFNPYTTAPKGSNTYGVKMINGPRATCQSTSLNLSYQLARNLFIDAGGNYRKYSAPKGVAGYSTVGPVDGPLNTSYVYFGVRLNAPRRDYTFF